MVQITVNQARVLHKWPIQAKLGSQIGIHSVLGFSTPNTTLNFAG